jgi:hypothetical protein
MTLTERKNAFVELGYFLSQFSAQNTVKKENVLYNELFFERFNNLIELSQSHNGWFTPEQVFFAIESWSEGLSKNNIDKWLQKYDFQNIKQKSIGLILAGNIPLVGFHDFLCVLLSGHKVIVKASTKDQYLLPFLSEYLIAVAPRFKNYIAFADSKLENFDAVIATGSNNTHRYFEYYFKDKPSIIRKNRNSVAVLDGSESKEQLTALGEDIFRYFGLGCRNVSKLFVPKGYVFDAFFEAIFSFQEIIKYEKYANNYDYNKAVFLMSNYKIFDNGFLTLHEDASYASPISSIFYEFYDDLEEIKSRLIADSNQIQCIVSNNLIENSIDFGTTQKPQLWDYADNVDTIDFLIHLK